MKTAKIFNELESRSTSTSNFFLTNSGTQFVSTSWVSNTAEKKVSVISKVRLFGIHLWNKYTEMSVDEFFSRIGRNAKELKIIDGIVDKYLQRIEKAEKMGQTALVEKMKDDIEVVKKEALASLCGVKKYLTKEQIDKLINKSDKNIEITFIKNFVRHIPDELLGIKEKLDKENVFDDYVIVHYDPKKENESLTKKEIEKKKDPVLFGVIKGSTNFYYIGDWIDEYCNLTLKEIVTIVDEKEKIIE